MAVPAVAAALSQNHRANSRNHPSAYLGRNRVRRGGVEKWGCFILNIEANFNI
jgi:hypothetical protein